MPDLKKLVVVLGLDKNQYSAGLKGAAGEAKTATGALQGSFNSMAKSLLAVAAPAAVFGAISKFAMDGVKEFVAYNKVVRETSELTGLQAEEVSRLIQVGDDWGVSSDAVTSAMKMMNKMGVEPSIDNLATLADEFVNSKDKAAFAEEATKKYGRQWSTLVPILKDGGKALRDQTAAVSDGLLATEESIRKARAYEVAMDNLGDASKEVQYALAKGLIPAIADATSFMAKGISAGTELFGMWVQIWDLLHQKVSPAYAEQVRQERLTEEAMRKLNNTAFATPPNIRAMSRSFEELTLSEEELKIQTEALKLEQDLLKSSMSELSSIVNGRLGPDLEKFRETQRGLNSEAKILQSEIDKLSSKRWLSSEQKTELEENRQKLKDIQDQIKANADEHDQATKRILLDMLMQRAAIDGLTADEVTMITTVAMKWGLIDEASARSMKAADQAMIDLANGEGIYETISKFETMNGLIGGVSSYLYDMNGKKFTTYYEIVMSGTNYHYTPPTGGGGGGGGGGTPAPVTGWRPRFPGDVAPGGARGLDMIVPGGYPNDTYPVRATSGERVTITPAGEKNKAGIQIGSVIMQITNPVTNGDQLYREFKRRLTEDLRTERLRS